ncbi:MAG: protein kinase [Calditrichia bacterium]|nr:protein kinase [Calditrichia bacterium]
MVGKTISHYKIIERIGTGGMGIVYKAQDLKLDRFVALKFLPPQLTTSEEEKQRFIHEAKAASSLDHNNICAIHEIDETEEGQLFISMAYYEGETLDKKIKDKPLPVEEAIDITIQIAQGLTKAHEKEIVHRDIKPANIMLTKEGVVKVLDFGLAKLSTQTKLTKESTTLGTVSYMSPEQAKGEEVDYRTDIWSLAVILYEMLTGQLPFRGDYESAVIYSILNDLQEPVTALRTGVPMELERIVNKCLQKSPSDRYQHIDELIVDLRGLRRESESTIIPSKEEKQKKRSKYVIMSVAVLSILILIIAGYFILIQPSEKSVSGWENSIAVLPFADLSPNKDQEYFCDGMTEQIITNLSKINRLKVIGRTSVMSYKNTDKKLPEIGKELNVSHILEGSIRKYGNSIRVTAQLINTEDGSHIWADDFDRELEHVFEVQDDISEMISGVLLQKLSVEEIGEVKSQKPQNIEAWEYYLKGKYFHINKFIDATGSMDDFNTSELMLKKAIELDPNYAPSYAALADLYNSYYNIEAQNEDEKKKYLDLQEKYIETAYNLDPNSADVYSIMGYVHEAKGELKKAYESFKKAILIQPNWWEPHYSLADFYNSRGLYHLAIKYRTKAIELNPLYPSSYVRRSIYFSYIGELNKAEIDLQKALEINPDHRTATGYYGYILILLEKYDEAEIIITKREKIHPNSSSNSLLRACLSAAKGERVKMPEINISAFYKSRLYLLLKMREEVIQYLNEDFEILKKSEGSRYLWLKNQPLCDFLRSDPRFQEILATHKEIYEENLAKYGDIDI